MTSKVRSDVALRKLVALWMHSVRTFLQPTSHTVGHPSYLERSCVAVPTATAELSLMNTPSLNPNMRMKKPPDSSSPALLMSLQTSQERLQLSQNRVKPVPLFSAQIPDSLTP